MNEANVAVSVNLKIMPFGCAAIEFKTEEKEIVERRKGSPIYSEPRTTIPNMVKIAFNGDDYIVPKTTNGSL
ncbi:MAG: hypothetical protein KKH04_12805 [Proteobacteria bacterium]|nr:hypothetical protein [Pseudomonadota bacterium]